MFSKTTNTKRSTKRPDKLAMVGKNSGVELTDAQLQNALGGRKAGDKP